MLNCIGFFFFCEGGNCMKNLIEKNLVDYVNEGALSTELACKVAGGALPVDLAYEVALKKIDGQITTEEEALTYIKQEMDKRKFQIVENNKHKRETMKNFVKSIK